MTETESIAEVTHLKALFPRMNQEQSEFWYIAFLKYPREAVRHAVIRFSERYGDFVDRPGLIAEIQIEAARPLAEQRVAEARREAQERRNAQDAQIHGVRATWKQIDALISQVNDEDLADYRKIAIDNAVRDGVFNHYGAEFMEKKYPRKCSTLKAMIYPMLLAGLPEVSRL